MADLYIGLMSGTSIDGVDGVLADFSAEPLRVLAHVAQPFAPALRAELLALNTPGPDELHRAALAANALAEVYASVVGALLQAAGTEAARVSAIGAHGQTVRHRPQAFDGIGYTVQINNSALLAERTGIDVVADFRSRDVMAGGQGAPLVPAFHAGFFGHGSQGLGEGQGEDVAVLNLGGIANLSLLGGNGSVTGFDCGPGNALMDHWCQQHRGEPFDADGAWAATGQVDAPLLQRLMAEPYLGLPPPKSTGRDLFNPTWLASRLAASGALAAQDVQATLAEFTVAAVAADVRRHAPAARSLVVCGGGALNGHVMRRLALALPGVRVASSQDWGLPPLEVEACAFAWLARECLARRPAGLPAVTGAKAPRVLGALYPR